MSGEVVQAAPPPFSIHYTLFPVVKSSPRAGDGRGNPAAPDGTERSDGKGMELTWSRDGGYGEPRAAPPSSPPLLLPLPVPSPSALPAPRTAQIRSPGHPERPQPEFRVAACGHVEFSSPP